jgi:hypothetical protein
MDKPEAASRRQESQPGADPQGPPTSYFEAHESSLRTMKAEIDALQIQIAEVQRPWYKHASNLVAILALIFSFGTTIVSFQHTTKQDIQQDRSELRTLSERIHTLERERIEFSEKYPKDQDAIEFFEGELNSELLVTALQAADIVERIPQHVSAAECTVVGDQLADFDNNDRSISILEIAVDRARDAQSLVLALWRYSEVLFTVEDFVGGREKYREALKAYERFPSKDHNYVRYTSGRTELFWAQSEIQYGHCSEAKEHVKAGVKFAHQMSEGSQKEELISWAETEMEDVRKCISD